MGNDRWEAWAIARWISERDLVFEPIKGKHLYHTGLRNNYMLNLQCEEKIQVTGTLFLYQNLTPVIQKLKETLFFISNFSYYYFLLD